MGFNIGSEGLGVQQFKTQNDIVAAQIESKPSIVSESMSLPGIKLMHLMNETELIDFLLMTIRIRPAVLGLEISLGDYASTERESTVPNATSFFDDRISSTDKVKAIIASLGLGKTVCGVRVVPVFMDGQLIGNKTIVKLANKEPLGPTYDAKGKELTSGDEEFNPKLTISYRP